MRYGKYLQDWYMFFSSFARITLHLYCVRFTLYLCDFFFSFMLIQEGENSASQKKIQKNPSAYGAGTHSAFVF